MGLYRGQDCITKSFSGVCFLVGSHSFTEDEGDDDGELYSDYGCLGTLLQAMLGGRAGERMRRIMI